ncbi:MAG: hypothetical protein KJZ94_09565 [Ignavibacteria bacterium]|nr:hypothetical protein [Ignavibacteria bacterium]
MRTFVLGITPVVLLLSVFSATAEQRWRLIHEAPGIGIFPEAQLINKGQILLFGGLNKGIVTANTYILDAKSEVIRPVMPMNQPRYLTSSVVMSDGKVYVIGGNISSSHQSTNKIECFDPQTEMWEVVGSISTARAQLAAVALDSFRIMIVGGRIGIDNVVNTCEIFDTRTRVTLLAGDFPYVTSLSQLTVDSAGRIIAFAGRIGGPGSYRSNRVWAYDESTFTWDPVGTTDSLYYPTMVTTPDKQLIWTGGSASENSKGGKYVMTIGRYSNGTFKTYGLLLENRCGHSAVNYLSGSILVIGGNNDISIQYKSCEFVDVLTGVSTPAPPLNIGRAFFKAVSVGSGRDLKVFAIGGISSATETSTIEVLSGECETTVQSVPPSRFTLRGSAYLLDTTIVLTDSKPFLAGAAWLKQKVNIVNDFTIQFGFRLLDGTDNELRDGGPQGADGVVLVFQPVEPAPLGDAGKGIGYDGIPHGLAIECDAFLNAAFSDPSGSHIAVQGRDGTRLRAVHAEPYLLALGYANVPNFVADGSEYHVKVAYANATLSVWVSKDQNFNDPVLSVPLNIPQLLQPFLATDGKAYAGITSATGFSQQQHVLTYVRVESCSDDLTSAELPESSPASGVEVFPNPLYGQSTVRLRFSAPALPGTVAEVYSRTGNLVLRRDAANHTEIDFEVPDVASGVYAIRIVRNGELVNTTLLHILR